MKKPPDLPESLGAACPYCGQMLEKRPKRKKKCPHCGNYIYVRKRPPNGERRVLGTEDEAEEIDSEWKQLHFRRKWQGMLQQYGIVDEDFDTQRKKLRERFGQEPGDRDVVWSLFHEALGRLMKSAEFQELRMLYFEMALFVYEEGSDFFHLLEQSRKMELTRYKQDGFVEKVQILTAGDASCEACQKLEGKVLTLHDALEQMPIPCKDCTFDFQGTGQPGWCRCLYGAVFD
ncbi:MAG TPA: hypothetical protein VMW58_14200 [Anaerolineae bacterium]|nr:hypothetical protein [Anaerolineae bacterium]